jgi:hypothetical protein
MGAKEENMGLDTKFSIFSVIFVILEICGWGWERGVGPTLVSSPF